MTVNYIFNRYQHQIMNDGTINQGNNPEVEVDVRGSNLLVSQQILRLKIITNKLKKAYAGIDVDYIDLGKSLLEYVSGK